MIQHGSVRVVGLQPVFAAIEALGSRVHLIARVIKQETDALKRDR